MASGNEKLISDCYIFPLISLGLLQFPLPHSLLPLSTGGSQSLFSFFSFPFFPFSGALSFPCAPQHRRRLNMKEQWMITEGKNTLFSLCHFRQHCLIPLLPFLFPQTFFPHLSKSGTSFRDGSSGHGSLNKAPPLRIKLLQL